MDYVDIIASFLSVDFDCIFKLASSKFPIAIIYSFLANGNSGWIMFLSFDSLFLMNTAIVIKSLT